jgi:hypothetical protein
MRCGRREAEVDKILATHSFGPHQVHVLECADDEGITYSIVVDGVVITDQPLQRPPGFEDVVRLYARSQETHL